MSDKLTIQIVEDEALIAENLKYTLEDLGYRVIGVAYTYWEAREALLTQRADLTLLDINLGSNAPDEDGLALARLMAQAATRPFLFMTAYSDQATIREATRLRPVGYLIKPVNPAVLFAAIQTAIEGYLTARGNPPTVADLTPEPDFFFVKVGNRTVKLRWQQVYCITAGKNYVQIRIVDTAVDYYIRGTLHFVTQQLVPPNLRTLFWQVNRSTYVNHQFITGYDAQAVYYRTDRIENTRLPLRDLEAVLTGIK